MLFTEQAIVISVYLSTLPVAHLSNAPRRRLVVAGDSASIQDGTTKNSAWFFNVLGEYHRHTGPRFNVTSIFANQGGDHYVVTLAREGASHQKDF